MHFNDDKITAVERIFYRLWNVAFSVCLHTKAFNYIRGIQ